MGFIGIIISDIVSDKINFIPMEDKNSGRNRIKRAGKFWKVNKGISVIEETLADQLLLGIGYNWVGKLSERRVKELCRQVAGEFYETKEDIETKSEHIYEGIANGETATLVKKLRYVAASTMRILTNDHEITGYLQVVGLKEKKYKPNEIIEFRLMPFDGKPYPFPPMEALFAEVYLLWLITQNYVSFFENGGRPDAAFILPKEIAGSKNHKKLIQTLQKYKKIQNRHGNLVFTGDLKIEDLTKIEDAMEHKDLGLYLVGVLAMIYGIPVGRIPFLIGKAANMGDSGGLADSGYWRKISVWQSKIEDGYNSGLFNPFFGVNIRFARGYKQDEIRETQNMLNRNSVAEQRMRLGLWDEEEAGKYLDIDPVVIARAQKRKLERDKQESQIKSGLERQNLGSNTNTIPEPDNRAKRLKKQETQLNNQRTSGKKINP